MLFQEDTFSATYLHPGSGPAISTIFAIITDIHIVHPKKVLLKK